MAYATPGTVASGDIITSALLNTAKEALEYLIGKAGAITWEDAVTWCNDVNFGGSINGLNPSLLFDTNSDALTYNRSTKTWQFTTGGTVIAALDANGIAYSNGYYSLQGVGPRRHIEAGTSASESVAALAENDDAFTFIVPFQFVPNVTFGVEASVAPVQPHIKTNTLTTTGVTITKYNSSASQSSTMITYYIAEGRD